MAPTGLVARLKTLYTGEKGWCFSDPWYTHFACSQRTYERDSVETELPVFSTPVAISILVGVTFTEFVGEC